MRALLFGAALATAAFAAPAYAQYVPVDPAPLGQSSMGVMGNRLSGDIASGERGASRTVSSRCLADSGPGPERRAMEAEYARRRAAQGRPAADAWRAEHGRQYRARLVAEGLCPRSR